MLVGKIVEFKVVRQSNNKYFGIITLDHNTPKAVNVNIEVVKNGHGTSKAKKVRMDCNRNEGKNAEDGAAEGRRRHINLCSDAMMR